MSHHIPGTTTGSAISTVAEAGSYIASVCFKHGPPEKVGIELEWLLIDPFDPARRVDAATLSAALGDFAPRTLNPSSPCLALPGGGLVTVEPGGQIEISSAPSTSVAVLITAMSADVAALDELLLPTGFKLSDLAADPHRPPRQLLHTPRYDAMAAAFDSFGPAGRLMMCSTAATQICLDLGSAETAADRWLAAHQIGPVLLAAFANSPRIAGALPPSASSRMASWWRLDPKRSAPPATAEYLNYISRVLDTQVLARQRPNSGWLVESPLTLRDWITSGEPVTTSDVDLHLSMLFPPVRPQGYLELRYLDAQPAGEWIAPLALIALLFATPELVRASIRCCMPAAGRWEQATEAGLADDVLRRCAADLLAVALPRLPELGLDTDTESAVRQLLRRRLAGRSEHQLTTEGSR
jgi:glutamate--cysteine ligase